LRLEFQAIEELTGAENGDSVVLAEFQQVPIAGDDEIGMAFDGAFQNAIVVRVVFDHPQ
jgi:hypothetical protein